MIFKTIDNLDQLIDVWPEVHKGLNTILYKCADECTWTPSDVFNSVSAAQALLIVWRENDIFNGFAVITLEKDHDGFNAHIWAAYNAGENNYLELAFPDIILICRGMGCKRITMSSNQKGWLRRGRKLGLRPVTTIYKIDI